MPSTRQYKTRGRRLEAVGLMNRHLCAYLEFGTLPKPEDVREDDGPLHDHFAVFALVQHETRLREVWRDVANELLEDWIATRPGTRPWACGSSTHRPSNVVAWAAVARRCTSAWPWRQRGHSVCPRVVGSTRGLGVLLGTARDVHGRLVNEKAKYRKPRFKGVAFDKNDPPRYESQASYLARHELLTDDERRRLPADAFEPEVIPAPPDDDEEPHDPDAHTTHPALIRLLLKGPGCLTRADMADREFGIEYQRGAEYWAAMWREHGPVLAVEAERAGVVKGWVATISAST